MNEEILSRREKAAFNMAVRNRNYRRARERALTRLAQAHREEYYEYLAEEKTKDEQEGKKWYSITGPDRDYWASNSIEPTDKAGRDTATNPQDEGNEK